MGQSAVFATLQARLRERLGYMGRSLVLVGVFGALSSTLVHSGCLELEGNKSVPDPDNPRGRYCSIVIPEKPWILMVIAPCAIVLLTGLVARRRGVIYPVAVVLSVLLIANGIVANSLGALSCQDDPLSCLK
jgi:hypothetical protein